MERTLDKPPPRPEAEEPPSQAGLVAQREVLAAQRSKALERVDELVRGQKVVSDELNAGISQMRTQGRALDEVEAQARQTGLLAALRRSFNRRRMVLERRSAAEGLLQRYEMVSVALRRASAFSDEVRLCALDLQDQVDKLHEDHARALGNAKAAARRVLDLEAVLDGLNGQDLAADDKERRADALHFAERSASTSTELFRASAELFRQELDPARALRDTMLSLHDEMSQFVLKATSAVNSAGRRIQALGMAADAPLVVAELQQTLSELGTAMQATEEYIAQTQHLLTQVLPDLSARIGAHTESSNLLLADDLDDLSRERARALADRALREAAEAEVDSVTRTL